MNSKIVVFNSLALTLKAEVGNRKFHLRVNSTGTWVLITIALLAHFAPQIMYLVGGGP